MLTATAGARALPTTQGRAQLCSLGWASNQQGQKDISLLYPAAFSSLSVCPFFSFRQYLAEPDKGKAKDRGGTFAAGSQFGQAEDKGYYSW